MRIPLTGCLRIGSRRLQEVGLTTRVAGSLSGRKKDHLIDRSTSRPHQAAQENVHTKEKMKVIVGSTKMFRLRKLSKGRDKDNVDTLRNGSLVAGLGIR